MEMAFCHACGKQIQVSAQFCPCCGANQSYVIATPTPPSHPVAAPAIRVAPLAGPSPDEIDALIWQARFALIDKAGGHKLPKIWSMPPKEIFRIRWNLWAFVLGPFYYAAKGMWKKGLTLFGLCVLVVVVGEFLLEAIGASTAVIALVPAALMSNQANVSYYRKVKEGFSGWW